MIAPQVLKMSVPSDEVVCLSRERGRYHEVILRMARYALDLHSQRSQTSRGAKEDTRRSQVLGAETTLEIGFLQRPLKLGEDVVGDNESKPASLPRPEKLPRNTHVNEEAGDP